MIARASRGLLLAALVGLAGCALPVTPRAHYILVHKEGDPIDHDRVKLTPKEFQTEFLDHILAGIDRHVATAEPGAPAQIMVFVHGGLNTYRAGLDRVNALVRLEDDPAAGGARWGHLLDTKYYPVFVNWNSSLWSSLWDDLFIVRRGERDPLFATATSPFVLLSRMAEAGVSIPRTVWGFVARENRPDGSDADEAPPDRGATWVLFAPIRGLTVPLLDAFGTGAWEIMKRRAAFVTARGLPREAIDDIGPKMRAIQYERRGAGRTLVEALVSRLCVQKDGRSTKLFWTDDTAPADPPALGECAARRPRREVELTLVGHSMGALVVHRLLLGFSEVPFRRVVFLGAAASIDNLETGVLPYLDRHPETEFHSVSLSMNDEHQEQGPGDLWERGSLLVWIDNLFERVYAPTQLRAGRCVNLFRPAPDEPESTRARYAGRVFFHKLTGKPDEPRRHGAFDEPDKLPHILAMVDGRAPRTPCAKPPETPR